MDRVVSRGRQPTVLSIHVLDLMFRRGGNCLLDDGLRLVNGSVVDDDDLEGSGRILLSGQAPNAIRDHGRSLASADGDGECRCWIVRAQWDGWFDRLPSF